ncbi:MAG: multidrug efflux system protein [Pseudomonadota bacterium]
MTTPTPLKGRQLIIAAFALALSNFVVVLDMTIANVSIPHIAGGLAISPSQGAWVITSYSVADAIVVPLAGWLSARFGTVRWFMISMTGFAVFSFLCGISRSIEALVIFRVGQGFFGGPLMPLSQVILMRVFPPDKTPFAIAIWAATTTAAPIFGPILGGQISDNWSWPWIFFINLPIIAICLFCVFRFIRAFESPIIIKRIDLIGFALLIVSVGSFQLILDTGRELGWFDSSFIVSLAIVAAIGLVAFLIWEWTDPDPVVDIRVFRNRGFAVGSLAIAFGFSAFSSSILLAPLWLQQVVGYSASQAGRTVAWVGVFAILAAPVAAKLSTRFDVRILASCGMAWMAMTTLMRTGWSTGDGYWSYALPQLVQGAGMPFFFISMTALAMGSIAAADQPSAAGLMAFTRTLSGAIGTAFAVSAYDNSSHVARSELASKINGGDGMMAQMQASGFSVEQARAMIERLVDGQAATMGMISTFYMAATAFVIAGSIIWLAPKPRGGNMFGGH